MFIENLYSITQIQCVLFLPAALATQLAKQLASWSFLIKCFPRMRNSICSEISSNKRTKRIFRNEKRCLISRVDLGWRGLSNVGFWSLFSPLLDFAFAMKKKLLIFSQRGIIVDMSCLCMYVCVRALECLDALCWPCVGHVLAMCWPL